MTREISLTQGKVAVVDDEDHERLSQFKWYAWNGSKRNWYAARCIHGHTIFMHREILGLQRGDRTLADHIDRDGLNNVRTNLRKVNGSQNAANKDTFSHSSRYKGVTYNKSDRKWRVHIRYCGKPFYLGAYTSEVDAAEAYDRRAIELHGEYAVTNYMLLGDLRKCQ